MGKVERYLLQQIKANGGIHITLLDPDKQSPKRAGEIAREAERGGTAAIMVGGSTVVSTSQVDETVKSVKGSVKLPVILFPNNVTGISRYADAIWFMSLLNTSNPYFLIKAQVLGAPLVERYGIEPIPMAYLVLTRESTVAQVGDVVPLSYDQPDTIASYALAAQYLGMRFFYLEAGSGAREPVPGSVIKRVKQVVNIPIIVGGGIRDARRAKECVSSGANVVVTGTLVEETEEVKGIIEQLVKGIRSARR